MDNAKDAGVLAYVAKPFGEAQLVPAVEVALRTHVDAVNQAISDFKAPVVAVGDTWEMKPENRSRRISR